MRYFIDTNIFLRVLINEDESTYRECIHLLSAIKRKKIKAVTSNLVIAEIVWTLVSYYKFPKNKVIEAVKTILNFRGLVISDDFDGQIALDYFQKNNVKYIDAVIASIKEIGNKTWIVVSYDHDFDKLKIERQIPSDILKHYPN